MDIIFWRMFLAHLLADFTLQCNFINDLKRRHWFGMVLHCIIHCVAFIALTYPFLDQKWVFGLSGWTLCFIVMVAHYIIDVTKVILVEKLGVYDGLLLFILDQLCHFYVIFAVTGPVYVPESASIVDVKWFILASIFVLVTHACTILVYYMEKQLNPNILFPSDDQKYFMIAERLILALFLLSDGKLWGFFILLWLIQMFYVRSTRILDISILNLLVSIILCCSLGLIGRFIFLGSI